jgi:hypothetical protein
VEASGVQGPVNVHTSFSSVTLSNIAGGIEVDNQNGAVEVSALSAKTGGCNNILIRTSFSPIRVYLPPDASFRVNARTSFGHVQTDFPITVSGSIGNDSIEGLIGNGACELRLNNSSSSIEILKARPSR